MGPGISPLAQFSGSDTLLFIQCQDYLSTGGRVTMKFFAALLGAYLSEGFNYISASLVDGSTGEILWYNIYSFEEYDIRNPEKAEKLVRVILKGFPGLR
ncbi:MAG: hypothetical protein HYY56_00870 [Candidatus Omnitrophica bacterium]|nr:hypothetical protein [Candidatus Omnitrophota bacterium]